MSDNGLNETGRRLRVEVVEPERGSSNQNIAVHVRIAATSPRDFWFANLASSKGLPLTYQRKCGSETLDSETDNGCLIDSEAQNSSQFLNLTTESGIQDHPLTIPFFRCENAAYQRISRSARIPDACRVTQHPIQAVSSSNGCSHKLNPEGGNPGLPYL
ncbi:hypothetical protein VTK56DRAFT_5128 [Thermocarpiscus australiensis]